MKFQILSHAGLLVESQGKQLICDPWILGSSYWRSWWNYPPVTIELMESLHPDFIYLTHIHWDHFHGPSLRRIGKQIKIIIPKTPGLRMRRDLEQMGFKQIIELRHGESFYLHNNFKITSYHFSPFLDSSVLIESDGVTLFNSNDAKMMGHPLKHILKKHPNIDFVFRSHSSANSRLCYKFIDKPTMISDDVTRYTRDFADFCVAVNARYAIPFASNHCYLHKDVFHFNEYTVTPFAVQQYFEHHNITHPKVKVMLSGDSWSTEAGFVIKANTYFSDRDIHIQKYREAQQNKLEQFYQQESKVTVDLKRMHKYFQPFFDSIPFLMRLFFKGHQIIYILWNGTTTTYFSVDVYQKVITELDIIEDITHPIQIHVPTSIMRHCLTMQLFSHLPISKRVVYRTYTKYKKILMAYNFLFNLYEYEVIPLKQLLSKRVLEAMLYRWREGLLYSKLLFHLLIRKKIEFRQYLPKVSARTHGTVNLDH